LNSFNPRHSEHKQAPACFGQRTRPRPADDEGSVCWRSGRNCVKRTASKQFRAPQVARSEDVGGSNPFTPTKKAQESTFLSLFFVYCTPIFANALPFFNRATTISGFEKLALFVIEC